MHGYRIMWISPKPENCARSTSNKGGMFKAYDSEAAKKLRWQAFMEIARRVARNFKLYSMTEDDRCQECILAILVNLEQIHAARTNPEGLTYKIAHSRLCLLYRKDKKLQLIPTSQMGDRNFGELPTHLALEEIMRLRNRDVAASNFIVRRK